MQLKLKEGLLFFFGVIRSRIRIPLQKNMYKSQIIIQITAIRPLTSMFCRWYRLNYTLLLRIFMLNLRYENTICCRAKTFRATNVYLHCVFISYVHCPLVLCPALSCPMPTGKPVLVCAQILLE